MKRKAFFQLIALLLASLFIFSACSASTPATENTPADTGTDSAENTSSDAGEASVDLGDTVKMYVMTKAGSAIDIRARLLAKHMSEKLGTNVVVENKEGAGGMLAIQEFLTQKGNPSDILWVSDSPFTAVPLFNEVDYSLDDFRPLGGTDVQGTGLFVNPEKTGIESMEDLVAYGKENTVLFGSGGAGSIPFLLQTALYSEAGMQASTVVHNSAAEGLTNCLGGHVDVTLAGLALGKDFVADGSLKCIATFDPEAYTGFGGDPVPSLTELGYEYTSGDLILALCRKDIPEDMYALLQETMEACLNDPAIQQEFADVGVQVSYMDDQAVTEYIENTLTFTTELKDKVGG